MVRNAWIRIVNVRNSFAGAAASRSRERRTGIWARRVFAISPILVFALCVPLMGQRIDKAVRDELAMKQRVRVIMTLREPVVERGVHPARLKEISEIQRDVLAILTADDLTLTHRWKSISAIAGEITAQGLAKLSKDPDVLQVDLDVGGSGGDATSAAMIHADLVQAAGYSGKAVVVAVLDSGIDSTHPDLAGAIIAEQCFCTNGNGTGCCPNGNISQSGPGSARDDHGHGTNVGGIVASAGSIAPRGIAPDAKIVAVRVLDSNSSFYGISQVLDGLDWVITTRPDVKAVNMSLGTYALYSGACDRQMPAFASAINILRQSGTAVFVCSMNNGSKTMMGAPACVSNAIAVGAVNNMAGPDQIASFTNSNSMLDLLAPGCPVLSTGRYSGTSSYCGTSQATPHATGGAALLWEADPSLTPDQIENALKRSGVYVSDSGNGLSFPRIDLSAALSLVQNGQSSVDFPLPAAGAYSTYISRAAGSVRAGYAAVNIDSGEVPFSTSVISLRQNGFVVSETGIPASPPTALSRIFIDLRKAVDAVPGRLDSGVIDINTGIAIVNRGSAAANVICTLRDMGGGVLSTGHGILAAGAHFAKFIDQLTDVAPDFNLPADFQDNTQFGSLEIAGDQPLSVLALRGTNNQRNDFLITTTPIADLTQPPGSSSVYFPQFVDGGGYTTSLVLMNTSGVVESGTLEILDDNGTPLPVQPVGGTAGASFPYSIQPDGVYRLQTDGAPAGVNRGWVRLIPDAGTSTPVGSGIFGYNPEDMLLSESGIPAATATMHARIYADLSGSHNTGLAIANVSSSGVSIAIDAYLSDGATGMGWNSGPLLLAPNGHDAKFADQFITGLPAGFTGVLDISSTTPFAALTLRSLTNERNDFLMTTFPVADVGQAAPSPIVFPQIADGGGYVTEFIFISPGGGSSAELKFHSETGDPLFVVN
jgi:subtilisin family serine protease